MNNVSVFNFNQKEVRTIVKKDGEIWFVLSDVCNVLEIGNVSMAASRLDAEEITLSTIEGSHRPTNLVNESGLYSLVLTSRKPEAKQFKKWVTSDVLPSIRKNGGYIVGQEVDSPELLMAKALQVANNILESKTKELEAAKSKVELLEPKAQALETIANTDGTYTIRECAKTINIGERKLISLLIDKKWIYREEHGRLQPYSTKREAGIFINRPSPVIINKNTGEEKVHLHMRITAYGLTKITELVNSCKHNGGFAA
ncbi:phage antirepressor KilAC domain-containing protein [Acinetobacter baumannii]|uniref:BRO family protein n=1 Tax=Acinetobacter baumannii TaxID=470 RepID=UPI000B451C06|nr:phage antirepressor KilAC domain-containing protein [Acinetobacter baumannii]AVI34388.1 BRO family, N-terminal domain protein [Acinetobacter baumannii]AVI38137.1 BRO family, N-terminal domain protein [Acinetobacter baumannii]EHU1571048.1 phage antirepressor KilAC domain-containing protein [Acinetobacter baumannii]EHU1627697.1 phage antirepressor KilAC domain-containing protein [Acinetobacter baumannii]EHU1652274.1 phage antirepressor KilAC domain-containing protein [Acinetobacter baumannii]